MKTSADQLGEWGESELAKLLKEYGYRFKNLNEGETGRRSLDTDFIAIAYEEGLSHLPRTFWPEAKAKTEPTCWGAGGNVWQHGINDKHYQRYLTQQENSGLPVVLFIFESTGAILYQTLERLGSGRHWPGRTIDKYDRSYTDMRYWDRRWFFELRPGKGVFYIDGNPIPQSSPPEIVLIPLGI